MDFTLLKDSRLFFVLVCVSLLLLLLDNSGLLNVPKRGVQAVSVPIQYGLYKSTQTLGNEFSFIFLARRAFQENKALTEQLAQVLSENADLRRSLAQAQGFLQEQQSLNPQVYTTVAARPVSMNRYLVVDQGSDAGIKVGEPVVYKDTMLGTIKQVSPKSSQVVLTTDPDSKIAAFSSNQNGKAEGILLGQFGSDMLMDQILHKENVSIGDLVYTSGTQGPLPRGLVLGSVSSVLQNQNQIFKQATIKPLFQIADLDILFVITN
jgi:rod shape-determining protein MreC